MNKKTTYKYKFSLVMAILKNKVFQEETIINLLEQTIAFKENIQLILVGLKNEENKQVIENYLKMYPNNIKFVECNSSSTAIARNKGLKYCEGKYINFINQGDLFSKHSLQEVYDFFEENYNKIDMVSVPIFFFSDKDGLHTRYKNFKSENYIVDLEEEPYNFVTSSSSTFYKVEEIKKIMFNENLEFKEDIDLNFKFYKKNRKFGYVCSEDTKYLNRKTIEVNKNASKNIFLNVDEVIKNILKDEQLFDYMKEYVLYELSHQLKNISNWLFEDSREYKSLIKKYKHYLKFIDDEFIIQSSKIISKLDLKYFLLKFKGSEGNFTISEEGNILYSDFVAGSIDDIHVKIKRMECIDDYLFVDIMFNDYDIEKLDVKFIDNEDNYYADYFNNKVKSTYDLKHGEFPLNELRLVKFKLPIKENNFTLNFINTMNSKNFEITNVSMLSFIKFSLYDENIKISIKNHSISFDKKRLIIKKEKTVNIIYKLKTFIHIMRKYNYLAFSRLLSNKKKKYILLNDRPEKAGDNGEALFKHINKYEKEMAKNTYFVLAKKDKEFKRLRKYGKVVIQNSFKHKYLYLNSKLILSSHACKHFYMPFKIQDLKYYIDLLDYKFVWLQHGIIHNNVARSVNKYNANIDYFVVSSLREQKEVQSERYFYEKDRIWLTGMPRYDYLRSNSKNIISLLPTWRRTLSGKIMSDGFHEIKTGFEQSDYYKQYTSILSSKKLTKLLEKNNFVLHFILHPGMAGYEDTFKKFESNRIKIISAYSVEYKKVFRESNLIITDYSSVAFDFSYLKKPIIYFQFDRNLFFNKHYERGYFDYRKDGFGEVIENNSDVIKKVEYYFLNNFKVEDNYLKNINKAFAYSDKSNCHRIISKLKDEKLI